MTSARDDDNRYYGGSTEQADKANKLFYERFGSFPAPPRDWRTLEDTGLWCDLVRQEIGDFSGQRVPDGGRIWVAGCGAVQAVEVALAFPRQQVLATDISDVALDFGRSLCKQLGLTNLEIKNESMFDATYARRFELVISRGVIHHTANPPLALQKLASALAPEGILDLTVLNRSFEGWQVLMPFQKALRILCSSDPDDPQLEADFAVGKALARELEPTIHFLSRIRTFFPHFNLPDDIDQISDHLLGSFLSEPNMHSYTVASFEALCRGAGLAMLGPGSLEPWIAGFSWELDIKAPTQRALYDALPEKQRWQMTNLLVPKQPRVLRFYAQHLDSKFAPKTEQDITADFLGRRFAKVATTAVLHTRSDDPKGEIVGTRREQFPVTPNEPDLVRVLEALDSERPIRETLARLGHEDVRTLDVLRRRLTTPVCPYLRAV